MPDLGGELVLLEGSCAKIGSAYFLTGTFNDWKFDEMEASLRWISSKGVVGGRQRAWPVLCKPAHHCERRGRAGH